MSNKLSRIMFMGTPEFAEIQLDALAKRGFPVTSVVTQPDKPKNRGHKLTPPPVKVKAEELGVKVYQPTTLRDEKFAEILNTEAPELIVVAAYGKILPPSVIAYPKYGCINVHGSLLPEYRGAAPIQRAIMDGKNFTGITTMLMDEGLDTGDMLLSREVLIAPDDDSGTLTLKMAEVGAELLVETIDRLITGKITPIKQDDSKSSYASKIEKSDCSLDFSLPAGKVSNIIRALSPEPLAVCSHNGRQLKIALASAVDEKYVAAPGTVISTKSGIDVATGDGILKITELIPAGKARMSADAFVNGRQIKEGDILSGWITTT